MRIAVLGSATLENLRTYLEVYCRTADLIPQFYVGPFGQYAQDILTDEGPLYKFAPDVIILAVHGRAIFPELYTDVLELDVEARRSICRDAADQMIQLIAQVTARTRSLLLVHSFATPQNSPLGIQEFREPLGQADCFRTINEEIATRIRSNHPNVHLIDEAGSADGSTTARSRGVSIHTHRHDRLRLT